MPRKTSEPSATSTGFSTGMRQAEWRAQNFSYSSLPVKRAGRRPMPSACEKSAARMAASSSERSMGAERLSDAAAPCATNRCAPSGTIACAASMPEVLQNASRKAGMCWKGPPNKTTVPSRGRPAQSPATACVHTASSTLAATSSLRAPDASSGRTSERANTAQREAIG